MLQTVLGFALNSEYSRYERDTRDGERERERDVLLLVAARFKSCFPANRNILESQESHAQEEKSRSVLVLAQRSEKQKLMHGPLSRNSRSRSDRNVFELTSVDFSMDYRKRS